MPSDCELCTKESPKHKAPRAFTNMWVHRHVWGPTAPKRISDEPTLRSLVASTENRAFGMAPASAMASNALELFAMPLQRVKDNPKTPLKVADRLV